MARRPGLTLTGLDSVIPTAAPADTTTAAPASSPRSTVASVGNEKISGYIDPAVAESARDAVSALGSHEEDPQTLGELIENALKREISRLETERNHGKPFPPRVRRRLKTGSRPS